MAVVPYPPALATVITSSPGPIRRARSASSSASVPLPTPTQCETPQKAANDSSKALTSAPRMYQPLSQHRLQPAFDLRQKRAVMASEIVDEKARRLNRHPQERLL